MHAYENADCVEIVIVSKGCVNNSGFLGNYSGIIPGNDSGIIRHTALRLFFKRKQSLKSSHRHLSNAFGMGSNGYFARKLRSILVWCSSTPIQNVTDRHPVSFRMGRFSTPVTSVFFSPWIQGKMVHPGENFPLDGRGGGEKFSPGPKRSVSHQNDTCCDNLNTLR